MNSPLTALLTQLNWQKNDILFQLNALEKECTYLIQQIEKLDIKLTETFSNSKIINPDLEISRLNYTLQIQEEKRGLAEHLKTQEQQKDKLHNKMQRIKTEMKMLERYFAKKQQQELNEQSKTEELTLDEWALQKRESA